MAGKTILELTAAASAADADLFLIRKDAETADRKITGALIASFVNSSDVIDNSSFEVLTGTNNQTLWEQNDQALLKAIGTEVIGGTGEVTFTAGTTTFNVAETQGQIKDSTGYYAIDFAGQSGISVTSTLVSSIWVYIDKAGTVQQQTTEPTCEEFREKLFLTRLALVGGTLAAQEEVSNPSGQYTNSFRDYLRYVPSPKIGMSISGNANLTFKHSAGSIFELGINNSSDPDCPNILDFSAIDPITFFYLDQDSTLSTSQTNINVTEYDSGGSQVTMTNNRFKIETVYKFGSGNIVVQQGQSEYLSLDAAQTAISTRTFIENPAVALGTRLGWIIVQKNATDLTNTTTARFVQDNGNFTTSVGTVGALLATNNLSDLSSISTAVSNLGLTIGVNTQAWDADLDAIAALAKTDGNFIVGNGSTWVAESGNTARTSLGLGTADSPQFTALNVGNASDTTITRVSAGVIAVEGSNVLLASGLGSITQAYDAGLQSIAGLTTAADRMIYTTASDTYAVTTLTSFARTILDDANASTARTTLGLGTIATQAANNVTITGGSITGITDLAIADGGTGAGTAAGARTNLGLVIGTDVQAYDAELAALAGLTSAANKVPYFTGSGTAGLLDFLDQDDMSSNSATAVPSQQSVKAYVDGASKDVLHVQYQQPSGTSGGSSSSGQNTIPLNTVVRNDIGGSPLSSNQITLSAGTYEVWATTCAFFGNGTRCRVRDITNSTTLVLGISQFNEATGHTTTGTQNLNGKFTLAGTAVIELQVYCAAARATTGLGVQATSGEVEVYGDILIRKVG